MSSKFKQLCLSVATALLLGQGASAYAETASCPVKGSAVPGQYDFYAFAMSNEDEFCYDNAEIHAADPTRELKPECAPANRAGVSKQFGLHGLWPNLATGCEFNRYPENFAPISVSEATKSKLLPIMPSFLCLGDYNEEQRRKSGEFCLPVHEWHKHGELTGKPIDQFFSEEADVALAFATLPGVRDLMAAAPETSFSYDEIVRKLQPDDTRKLLVLPQCKYHQVKDSSGNLVYRQYLMEIQIALDKAHFHDFPKPESFNASFPGFIPYGKEAASTKVAEPKGGQETCSQDPIYIHHS